jgi:hypothetical protein
MRSPTLVLSPRHTTDSQKLWRAALELGWEVVVDVGFIRDRGWAVIEQNAAWGAGIYECDPLQVLEVLRAVTAPP